MTGTWAVVPVKSPSQSKSRLLPVLSHKECARLCLTMLQDVLHSLQGAARIDGIAIVSNDAEVAAIARTSGHEVIADKADSLCGALDDAAGQLAARGVKQVLIIPADVPTVTAADIDNLIEKHKGGLSISPAIRDGGTNALICSPPDAVKFCYGKDSARKHLQHAEKNGTDCSRLAAPAFFRDIDLPEDLLWLYNQPHGEHTLAYLRESGIGARLQPALGKAV